LPPAMREQIQQGLRRLETAIWQAAEHETEEGFLCNSGSPRCAEGKPGRMTVLDDTPQDRQRRSQLLRSVVLPKWIERCGEDCVTVWNRYMAAAFDTVAVGR
jgi:hypothetical protein